MAILLCIAIIGGAVFFTQNSGDNNTTNETNETNLTINDTNNTTENATIQTESKKTESKQTTQKSSKKSENKVTYDPELNAYFDSNGRTVTEGQFPKGTSKSEMRQAFSEIERETNI